MATASLAEARSHNVPADVFLRHWREIRDAKTMHSDSGMAVARAKKQAKAAGIDLDAFKLVEQLAGLEEDELEMLLKNILVYSKWLKLPIGTQSEMFSTPVNAPEPTADSRAEHDDWEAQQQGLAAGKGGVNREDNPFEAGSSRFDKWDRAWAKGNKEWTREQSRIAGEMGENSRRGRTRSKEPELEEADA